MSKSIKTESPLNRTVNEFSSYVANISNDMCAFFDKLYRGVVEERKKNSVQIDAQAEYIFSTVKAVIHSTSDPFTKAERLVRFVQRTIEALNQKIEHESQFDRSEERKNNFNTWVQDNVRNVIDACLLINDALKFGFFQKVEIKNKKGEIDRYEISEIQIEAERLVNLFLKWEYDLKYTVALPEFNDEEKYTNMALFQQLTGYVPVAPICEQILPFALLDWQKQMFQKLREGKNVIVCAPTSSGKTMIATNYIIAFLKNERKSKLVYIVPNDVLGLEIAATLNKFVKDQVSVVLDQVNNRKSDERVLVCTPKGAFNTGIAKEALPANSLLAIDEVHCIENLGGSQIEYVLRRLSNVQTLILSATMTEETIGKLKNAIRNDNETFVINEKTKFINPQFMIPKIIEENVLLSSVSPIGSLSIDELKNPNLDIAMTPRDVLALFNKVIRTMGINKVPEYLHPIRFFYIHNCSTPPEIKFLDDLEDENDDNEDYEPPSGLVHRLSLDDVLKWQKAIIHYLNYPPQNAIESQEKWTNLVQNILDQFKSSLTDETTCECTPENASEVIDFLKKNSMLPAIFFFPSVFKAFEFADHIYQERSSRQERIDDQTMDERKEKQIDAMKKQLRSMKQIKTGHNTDVKDLRERQYQMKLDIDIKSKERDNFHIEHSLNPDNIISRGGLTNLVRTMNQSWNNNIIESSSLSQMLKFGIGILSGDMPHELQVKIRELFNKGSLALLMATDDCAYGINTPAKTVILSDGFTETQRRQMAGRAGRKGHGYNAWIVSFRLHNASEAGQQLRTLNGEEVQLLSKFRFPKENSWITRINRKRTFWHLTKDDIEDEKWTKFYFESMLLYQQGAILAPSVLEAVIKSTVGQTNRHIKTILSILPLTKFNQPFRAHEVWEYELPNNVKDIYSKNELEKPIPNFLLYNWLSNQVAGISEDEMEMFVENAKHWIYLFHLLKNFFPENEKNLYNQINETITRRLIATSIGF